jgi:hypothetical protein
MNRIKKFIVKISILFVSVASFAEYHFKPPTDKVMSREYVDELHSDNLEDSDSVLLRCIGREASSFIIPKRTDLFGDDLDATLYTDGGLDQDKIRQKFGNNVDFIISIDDMGIAIITGIYLKDKDAYYTDNITYKDFLIFLDMGNSKSYPWKEFSTVEKRMRYGRQFSGLINRYTGNIIIRLDGIRSKSKDAYTLKATCKPVKKIF